MITYIFTDGSSRGNPGPGGWGSVVVSQSKNNGQNETLITELGGRESPTTNNRMELMAAITALETLKRPCDVDIFTDSTYVRDGVMGWIHGWKRNGWMTSAKKPVKNVELWKRLDEATGRHNVEWHWVKGHAGHDLNERADELAREGMAPFKKR